MVLIDFLGVFFYATLDLLDKIYISVWLLKIFLTTEDTLLPNAWSTFLILNTNSLAKFKEGYNLQISVVGGCNNESVSSVSESSRLESGMY